MNPLEFEQAAKDAAEAGGDVLRHWAAKKSPVQVEVKGLHDFVTEADRAAETAVLDYIRGRYPDHAILSEEASPEDRALEGPRWVVDPLDGTTNFIHGVPHYSVSVALEDNTGLLAAAIHDPSRRETFHASRGGGARLDGEPMAVAAPASMGESLFATGFPFRELSRLTPYLQTFEAFVRTTAGLRRAGSAAIDLAWTACGRYDAFWEIGLSRWDVAAGVLLVREAGGIVTDVVGGDSTLATGDVLAAGPALHASMLEVTRAAFA